MKTRRLYASVVLVLTGLLAVFLFGCSERAASDATLVFDTAPGIYQERFTLTVSTSDPSLSIRYTTNSALPTVESELYAPETGIAISYRGGGMSDPSSVNIIRCAAFDAAGNQVGKTITGTYILADMPDVRYSTMIVSIVCDPDDLYGYERGILVTGKMRDDFNRQRPAYWTNDSLQDANFFQTGIDWERPAHVEFYSQTGDLILGQNVGIRVSGGWNRASDHKSLRLFARYLYDDANVMSFDAYPGLTSLSGVPVGDFKTLILRTGSNNMWNTTIQTQFLMQLGGELGIETMHYRPLCVYINGKYYGYMGLYEDYGTTYFETNYNIPSEEITCINGTAKISGGHAWELDNGPTSELSEFNRMLNYLTTLDMREDKYYQKASEMLDLDSFIKYMCFQGYISNSDWPQNNVRVWRRYTDGYQPDATDYGYDGRWRFLLKDLDLAAGYSSDRVTDSIFKRLNSDDYILRLNAIFQSLFENPDFKNRVYVFLCDLLSTTMQVDHVMATLGEVEASALLEMRYYTKSYGASGGSLEEWHTHLETPARFFTERYAAVYAELPKRYDSVWGTLDVQIEGEGVLSVGTLSLDTGRELSYLAGLTVPVSATPAKGWRVKELTIGGKEVDGEFRMSAKPLTLTVVFEPDTEVADAPTGLIINEMKYNHASSDASPDLVELYNAGTDPIYLKGYILIKEGLRDDGTADKDSWYFPAITLGAGDYMVIACDKLGTRKGQSDYHASFGIGIGDTLTIVDRLGVTIDRAELINCNNFTVLARDGDTWYYEPTATFGEPNADATEYDLATVIDPRARGVFILKGRFVSDLAEKKNGVYTVTARSLMANFGEDRFKRYEEKLSAAKTGDSYNLEQALEIIGYRMYYISALDSYVIYKR